MDKKRSYFPFVKEVIDLVRGKRMELDNMRQSLMIINEVAEEVKQGRKYIIFPEGGYDKNHNEMQDFMAGAFKCAVKAKAPIVSVAIIDSYKVFGINSLRSVETQVHFLEPLYYEEYAQLNTREIAEIVKQRISEKIDFQLELKTGEA